VPSELSEGLPVPLEPSERLPVPPGLSEGLPVPREPAYADKRSQDGEAPSASE